MSSHIQVSDILDTIGKLKLDDEFITNLKAILTFLAYQSSDSESAVNGHIEQWRTDWHDQMTGNTRVTGPKKSTSSILNKPSASAALPPSLQKIFSGQKKFDD